MTPGLVGLYLAGCLVSWGVGYFLRTRPIKVALTLDVHLHDWRD